MIQTKNEYIPIELLSINGKTFNTKSLNGKPFMISFFRFASCPFCNLRMNQLIQRFDEFGNEFTIVAIFDSSLENLQKHNDENRAPFPILADAENVYYTKYDIKKSLWGMLKGMIFRLPTLIKGIFQGYIPFPPKGSFITMPADILVDKNGIVQVAYYGKDEGDHLDFDIIKQFSLKN